jgi:hypothetical protein
MKLAARPSPCVRYAPLARTSPSRMPFELSCRAFQNRGVARAEPVGWIAGSSSAMTRERAPSRFRSRRSATEPEANARSTSASRIRKCASAGADGTSVSPGDAAPPLRPRAGVHRGRALARVHDPQLGRPAASRSALHARSGRKRVERDLGGHAQKRSDRAFTSSLSCRTISLVLRMSGSLRATPMADAIERSRASSSR